MNYAETQPPPEPRKPLEPVVLPAGAKWLAIGLVVVVVLGILALTAGPSIWRGWRERQVIDHGTDAKAELLQIKDTGDRFNDNPVVQLSLEITPSDRKPYRATVEKVMSAVELKKYDVGDQVFVRYDPDDPALVVLLGPVPVPP